MKSLGMKMTLEEEYAELLEMLAKNANITPSQKINKFKEKLRNKLPFFGLYYNKSNYIANGLGKNSNIHLSILHVKNGRLHSDKYPAILTQINGTGWYINGNYIREFNGLIKLNEAQKKKLEILKLKFSAPPAGIEYKYYTK